MVWTYSSTKKMEKLLQAIAKKAPALHAELLDHQAIIVENPQKGYQLSGDLREYMSYDFTFKGVSVRICYAIHDADNHIVFIYCGTRENFYKELKIYLFG